jgi:hypothetical protein
MVAAKLRFGVDVSANVPERDIEWEFDGAVSAAFARQVFRVSERRSGLLHFKSSTVEVTVFETGSNMT